MTTAAIERTDAGVKRGSGGRPTREEAARRHEHLIAVATTLFMERGFDATSIEAVAEATGMSKPTVYARYRDKRALFEAVLRERIAAWLAPLAAAAEAQASAIGPADVETVLDALSRALLAHAQSPGAAMLTRCLAAQAVQFPELARLAHEEGWLRGVRAVATVLEHFAAHGQIAVADAETAADLFVNMVLGRISRLSIYGIPIDAEAQERRRRAAVAMFLDGVRVR
jgi:AcrR family transcriptional regulator